MAAPFVISKSPTDSQWGLWMRPPHFRFVGWFASHAEAVAHMQKHWPWWM